MRKIIMKISKSKLFLSFLLETKTSCSSFSPPPSFSADNERWWEILDSWYLTDCSNTNMVCVCRYLGTGCICNKYAHFALCILLTEIEYDADIVAIILIMNQSFDWFWVEIMLGHDKLWETKLGMFVKLE